MTFLALVELNDLFGVDGKTLVGVDDHAEEAGIGLQERKEETVRGHGVAVKCQHKTSTATARWQLAGPPKGGQEGVVIRRQRRQNVSF